MIGAYASFLFVFGAASVAGLWVLRVAGRLDAVALAPAIGLAALCPVAWWAIRLPGDAGAAIIAVAAVAALATVMLSTRRTGTYPAIRDAAPVAVAALALASLPFIVEGRYGILGTGLNPDMSQHLFAVDRLVSGGTERLISEGYPLGPHALVGALAELGPSTVEAFNGLSLAVAVAACLVPLALLRARPPLMRAAAALCIGLTYLFAAYLVQGAFKEVMQALFVLAFAVALSLAAAGDRAGSGPSPSPRPGAGAASARAAPSRWRGLPAAVLAIGSIYVYSFAGLLWLAGALGLWAAVEAARHFAGGGLDEVRARAGAALPAVAIALGVVVAAALPELGRMVEFARFETFDPDGAGLGNLFNRLSPLEALGIWPSGDFRVEPGDGAIPAIAFYAGAALAAGALAFGLVWHWRRRETAILAALLAAAILWLYALVSGTPYQEAKALMIAAPLVALVSLRAMSEETGRARRALAVVLIAAMGGSSVLVLANGPVGPSGYTPQLAELNGRLSDRAVLVVAPRRLLDEQQGVDYLLWELRGNRVCLVGEGELGVAPAGALTVGVYLDSDGAVAVRGLTEGDAPFPEPISCPLITESARADPAGDE